MPRIAYLSRCSANFKTLFTLLALCAISVVSSQAQTFTSLADFDSSDGI